MQGGGATPQQRPKSPGLLGIVTSPLQYAVSKIRGVTGPGTPGSQGASQPASNGPSADRHAATAQPPPSLPGVQGGSNTNFTFPTLPGAKDSSPTGGLSATPASAQPNLQHQQPRSQLPNLPHFSVLDGHPAESSRPMPTVIAAPALAVAKLQPADLMQGWSPSKLSSLNYFLSGGKVQQEHQQAVTGAPLSAHSGTATLLTQRPAEMPRPYQGLKHLLRCGPAGFAASNAAQAPSVSGLGMRPSAAAGPSLDASGPVRRGAAPLPGNRYNPYGRPGVSKPPRPGGPAPPASQHDQHLTNAPVVANGPSHVAPPSAAAAVAAGQLPPPSVGHIPAGGRPPMTNSHTLRPFGTGNVRLAPGQVAFASGRTGTPLPKFLPASGPGARPAQHQQLALPGPSGQPSFAGPSQPAAWPVLSSIGGKRPRDSPAPSPLVGTGIKSLSEFKRARQSLAQHPRSILSGLSARPTTSVAATPGSSDNERSATATPGGPQALPSSTDVPATETARKILETLDNFARASDMQHATPPGSTVKSGAATGQRTGPAGSTPFPGGFMPPLDRLEENHYGGTPHTMATGAAGRGGTSGGHNLSGNTPASNAGATPGPRLALFQSPAPSPIRVEAQSAALPLSPIAAEVHTARKPEVAAANGVMTASSATAAASTITFGAASPTAIIGTLPTSLPAFAPPSAAPAAPTDAAAAKLATDKGDGTEPKTSASGLQFAFRDPAAPSEPRLKHANEALAEANASSSTDVPRFTFTAPHQGVHSAASANAAASTAPPSSVQAAPAGAHEEVRLAACVPLPDDSDDEQPASAKDADAAAAAAPSVSRLDEGTSNGAAAADGAARAPRRVSFAPQAQAAGAATCATEEGAPKGTPAQAAAPSTPQDAMPSPAGFGFSFGAGHTPYKPPVGAPINETPSASQDAPQAAPPALTGFSFKPPAVTAAASSPIISFDAAAPSPQLSFAPPPATSGTTAAPATASFTFGAAPSSTAEPPKPASELANSAGFGSGATAPSGLGAPGAGGFTFGAASSAAARAAPMAPASAAAATSGFMFGASTSSEPAAPVAASSSPAVSFTFGAAAPAASAPAPSSISTGFSFGAQPQPTPASTSALQSAPAPMFAFGAAAPVPTAPEQQPPAASPFGSPLPAAQRPPSPSFGQAAPQQPQQPAGFGFGAAPAPAAGGFGEPVNGGFGAASAPGFGAQASSAAASAPGFGFGAQPSAPNFTFGAGATPSFGAPASSGPTFGAPQAATAFGAAPAQGFGGFGAVQQAQPAPSAPAFGVPAQGAGGGLGPNFGASSGFSLAQPAPSVGSFTFGGGTPGGAPAFGGAVPQQQPASLGFGAAQLQQPAPAFGSAPVFGGGAPAAGGFSAGPPSPGPDAGAGGGFSIGFGGDAKDGRKRVKARRHGH